MINRTAADIEDRNQRTTAVGLFMFGESYMVCAVKLVQDRPKELRFNAPIEFLMLHGIELYLKSFLRGAGVDITELESRKYGHNFRKLTDGVSVRGRPLREIDVKRLKFCSDTSLPIEARYSVTGYKEKIPLEDLMDTARKVRELVKEPLIRSGVRVREAAWIASLPGKSP